MVAYAPDERCPVDALGGWLAVAKIESGSNFLKLDRLGNVSKRALDQSTANVIVKTYSGVGWAGTREFYAHRLRSGLSDGSQLLRKNAGLNRTKFDGSSKVRDWSRSL